MTNEEYWQERTTELESKWFNKCRNEIEKELADYYMSASQHIQDDIAVLYARFAEDNNLSFLSARKLIQGNEFSTWRMDIEGYLKQIDIALNKKTKKQLLKELNTLAMRSRINKLEKLHGETLLELTKLATLVEQDMTDFFKRCYADTYYRDLFAIGQKIGLNPKQARMDNERLEKLLAVPWSGRNYSSRIWENQSKLAQTIKETVMNGVHRGLSVPKMSAEVARCMEVGKSQAVRLVRTEMNYVQNQAILDSIRSSGLKYYRFCATLDKKTSAQCRAKDGNIFPVDEAKAGSNLPPLHPHCRSTVVASLKADSKARGWRIARNDDGSIVHIPADLNYTEWAKYFKTKEAGGVFGGYYSADFDVMVYLKEERYARQYYDLVRNRKDDVGKIAKNTGYATEVIQRIKNHVFFDEHILESGTGRFDSEFRQALAWHRLTEGEFIEPDLVFLSHELLENIVEKAYNLTYREAHAIAEAVYDWDSAENLSGGESRNGRNSMLEAIKNKR